MALLSLIRSGLIDLNLLASNKVNAFPGFEPDGVHGIKRNGVNRICQHRWRFFQQDRAPQRYTLVRSAHRADVAFPSLVRGASWRLVLAQNYVGIFRCTTCLEIKMLLLALLTGF